MPFYLKIDIFVKPGRSKASTEVHYKNLKCCVEYVTWPRKSDQPLKTVDPIVSELWVSNGFSQRHTMFHTMSEYLLLFQISALGRTFLNMSICGIKN